MHAGCRARPCAETPLYKEQVLSLMLHLLSYGVGGGNKVVVMAGGS
jgi:hypothetical protein